MVGALADPVFEHFRGLSLISQEGPLFQELTGVTAVVAGGMVGVASLGNGVGRVFWAWVSDLITRRATFAVMFILQVLLFWFVPTTTMSSIMTIVAFVILMCYGGGFGTMPAFTADYFGPKNVGPIYGLMLTAWSFASVSARCTSRACARPREIMRAHSTSSPS